MALSFELFYDLYRQHSDIKRCMDVLWRSWGSMAWTFTDCFHLYCQPLVTAIFCQWGLQFPFPGLLLILWCISHTCTWCSDSISLAHIIWPKSQWGVVDTQAGGIVVYYYYYLYFDRITYIISEDIQINTIVFSTVLWSVNKILIVWYQFSSTMVCLKGWVSSLMSKRN